VKDRQFTTLNLLGLSSGLAFTFLIFLWVNDEISIDKFHEKDEQLFKVMYNYKTENDVLTLDLTPSPLAPALVTEMPEVEKAVSVNRFIDWFEGKGVAAVGENQLKAQGIFATKDYFDVFSYKLIDGDKNLVLADKQGVVISRNLAMKLFKSTENILGKPIQWNHRMVFRTPLHVAGIFENLPGNSTDKFDIIFNYDLLLEGDKYAGNWNATYAETYLILKKGTNSEQFGKKIMDFAKVKDPSTKAGTLFLVKYSDKYLHGKYTNGVQIGGRIEYVRMFSVIAVFILLIACVNYMNLSTAQASKKFKAIGISKTLGASRKNLLLQFLGESFLMSLISAVISIIFVVVLLPLFNEITGKQISLNIDFKMVSIFISIVFITSLLSGIYPALYFSGLNPLATLKGKLVNSFGEIMLRKGLVVFQFSLSVCFIIGFLLIRKQMDYLQSKNLGYNRENIITFQREGDLGENPDVFLSEIKQIPGVQQAASMAQTILNGNDAQSGFSWRGVDADKEYQFKSPRIGYDVIETLGMQMTQGRSYSRQFNDDNTKIILNESALRKMALEKPIGKIIKYGNSESQIIGIVKDFQYGSMHQAIEPLIFRFRNAGQAANVIVKIKAGSDQNVIKQIENYYKKFHPEYPFEYSFLDADYNALYKSEEKVGKLSNLFSVLAIFISCLGLFGLATFTAQKRQKEIGIRKVLGASVFGISTLLSKDFIKLVVIAIAIACPLAYYFANNWLHNFAYHIDVDWRVFAFAGIAAILIALLTVSFQAVKTAIANPVKSLRTE